MEFCSHFEQIAYPPNFLRELALKFCFRQKSLKLRHSSNWAANLFKIWQNSNAAFSVAYLVFIIYQKSKVWTITRIEKFKWLYVGDRRNTPALSEWMIVRSFRSLVQLRSESSESASQTYNHFYNIPPIISVI